MLDHCTDFVLPDVFRLRVLNAKASDIAAIQRQVGPLRAPVQGDADIVIRFQDDPADLDSMCILGNWEAGYTTDAFWILRGAHGCPIAVEIPFERIGMPCELRSQHSIPALPLLGSILNLLALQRGFLPLHASAFIHEGESVLVTGWTKGGKTEALLGFGEQGAYYVGDEWVYIDPKRGTMRGVPQRIHLWDWHFDSTSYRNCLSMSQRLKLFAIRHLQYAVQPLAGWHSPIAKASQRISENLKQRRHVRATPKKLFADRVTNCATCPQRIYFMASHAADSIDIRPMPIAEIAARMAVSLEEEFSTLLSWYRKFRFAMPHKSNRLLEELPALLRERLAVAFQGKEGHAVWHPYPISPRRLFRAMSPYVHGKGAERPTRRVRSVRNIQNTPKLNVIT